MKQFIVMHMIPEKITQSDALMNMLLNKAHAMAPLLKFLEESVQDY
jgi:hypothetical protein